MKFPKKRQVLLILLLSAVGSLGMFLYENVLMSPETVVSRNTYGEGKKTEEYELTIEDEEESKDILLEIEEQEYTREEIQALFQEIMEELDEVILGENKSLDRIEYDLNLVTELEDYPVQIQWELDSYDIMNIEGQIREENLPEEGTLLGIRGTISYGEEKAVYVRNALVFPITRVGIDKLLYEIKQEILRLEEETRTDAGFTLPEEVSGVKLEWNHKKENYWYYILIIGIVLSVFVVYREREKVKQQEKMRGDALVRMYPGMVSKFTMLLGTGTTVKNAWEKIVQNYEAQKEQIGTQVVYEEMCTTLREIRGGVSESEAYERFGKRCGITIYMKFGMMLSQNLRKGSKGISDILRMEAIQSFENRKSIAKRLGEEAGAKLLMPMMGMLAVVLIMVMVPAFLSMQL